MEPERRRPVGWLLVAAVAALLGAAQVVLTVAWLMVEPEQTGRALLAIPWLLLWYLVALGALRAARREPHADDALWDLWDDRSAPSRTRR
jgi:hypothetical protein